MQSPPPPPNLDPPGRPAVVREVAPEDVPAFSGRRHGGEPAHAAAELIHDLGELRTEVKKELDKEDSIRRELEAATDLLNTEAGTPAFDERDARKDPRPSRHR